MRLTINNDYNIISFFIKDESILHYLEDKLYETYLKKHIKYQLNKLDFIPNSEFTLTIIDYKTNFEVKIGKYDCVSDKLIIYPLRIREIYQRRSI